MGGDVGGKPTPIFRATGMMRPVCQRRSIVDTIPFLNAFREQSFTFALKFSRDDAVAESCPLFPGEQRPAG